MDKDVSGTVKSDDLQSELRQLKMNLERSNKEKADAAEYGLAILEEKKMLKLLLEQKESSMENLRAQLNCAQEALAAMQQHNKALEEADIAEEEKRMIHEEMSRREREDLENELRSYKKQLSHSLEERDKLEELMKQSQLLNENTKAQLKKVKDDLKDCESRESFALKNCDILESDNVELQLQVSHLLKSLQHFDAIQSENKRLLEKVDELSSELKRHGSLKAEMERSLRETNDMLRDEREMKMRYKRELDSRVLSDEGTFLNASTVASIHSLIGGPSSMAGDISVDNISALLDGFMTCNDDEEVDDGVDNDHEKLNAIMSDSLEDVSAIVKSDRPTKTSDRKENKKSRNRKSKDLMSELMMSHDEYVVNIEHLEMENLKLNKTIEDLKKTLEKKTDEINIQGHSENVELVKLQETSTLGTQTESSSNEENMDDALRCLQNLRVVLLDMVTEAQSTYTTLCNAAEESLNSKAMTHVDARKASVRAKVGRSDGDVLKSRIPSFVLSKSLPKNTPVVDESVWMMEVDCTKLLASSIDLMRYSRRVANRMLDAKVAVRARESSPATSSLASSFSIGQSVAVHAPPRSSNFELHEQIFQLQSLLAAKTEQMMSLRQMLTANKSVYESSIDKLKQQHDAELKMKMRIVEDLKSEMDGLKEKEGMKFVSEQTLIKQCDQYSSEMNDLQERLSCSELERKTLNSLLRIAIQHKLILLKKLQGHGISVDLFSDRDSRSEELSVDGQSEGRRANLPSPRPPMRSRFSPSRSSNLSDSHKHSSFAPLLYNSSKYK